MTNYVIILSGGWGGRFGGDLPKQFADLKGQPILHHTISAFQNSEAIDKIIVVANRDYVAETKGIANEFSKVENVVAGGVKTRSQSSYNGVMALNGTADDNVLIHDGARPFTNEKIITNCINALNNNECITTAVPATDTVYEMNNNKVVNIPERKNLVNVQTPQGFKYDLIKDAYDMFDNELSFSDDCSLVKNYFPDTNIFIVQGDTKNIKITNESDLK